MMHKYNRKKWFLGFFAVSFFSVFFLSFANSRVLADERDQAREETLKTEERKLAVQRSLDKLEINAGFFIGFDDNVNLDSSRKSDTFEEFSVNAKYKFDLDAGIEGSLEYSLFSMVYNRINDATVVDNNLSFKLKKDFAKRIKLEAGYDVEPVLYPNSNERQYIKQGPTTAIRHYLNRQLYQRLNYTYYMYYYTDRHAFNALGNESNQNRDDREHEISYELGFALLPKALIKLKAIYQLNDSNDKFMDYYDYSANEGEVAAYYYFTPNFHAGILFNFTRRKYDSRLTVNGDKKQIDDIYSPSILFDCKLTKDTSLITMYSYRKNKSNESTYRYSNNLVSIGILHSF